MEKKSRASKTARPYLAVESNDILLQLWAVVYSDKAKSIHATIPLLAQAGFGSILQFEERLDQHNKVGAVIYPIRCRLIQDDQAPAQRQLVQPPLETSVSNLSQRLFCIDREKRVRIAPKGQLQDLSRPAYEFFKQKNLSNTVQVNLQRRQLSAKIDHKINPRHSSVEGVLRPYFGKTLDYFKKFSDKDFLLAVNLMKEVLGKLGDLETVFTSWRPLYANQADVNQLVTLIYVLILRFDHGVAHHDGLLKAARDNKSELDGILARCIQWKRSRNEFLKSACTLLELLSFWKAADTILEVQPNEDYARLLDSHVSDEDKSIVLVDLSLKARLLLPEYFEHLWSSGVLASQTRGDRDDSHMTGLEAAVNAIKI